MVTVVTGFEPFGGAKSNISELVVRELVAEHSPDVVAAALPTSHRGAASEITEMVCKAPFVRASCSVVL